MTLEVGKNVRGKDVIAPGPEAETGNVLYTLPMIVSIAGLG